MSRRSLRAKRGIITGASSGIGWALALELARSGARLIVTARRAERCEALVAEIQKLGGEAFSVPGDIVEAALREQLLATVGERFGGLDFLVNNAGIGAVGPFAEATPERLRQVMEVNFFAPAELLRAALPLLRAGDAPIIVNVSSVLGHRAVPNKSEYCASKFALHGLSDAIRAELVREKIDLLLVSPSTTSTEFFDHALDHPGQAAWTNSRASSSEYVARCTARAMEAGRHEIILTAGGKLLVWLDRLCPPLANWLIAKYGQGKMT